MRSFAILMVMLPGLALAEPEFSSEANDLLQLCRFGWAGEERIETFAVGAAGWQPGTEGATTMELRFIGDDLSQLTYRDGTDHYDSLTVVCFRHEGWPVVAVTSEWFVGHKLCTAGGVPIPLPGDGSLQLRVQKLTGFAATGLFHTETALMLGAHAQDPARYCGPDDAMAAFLRPFEYLGPGYAVLQLLDGIRSQ